MNGIDPPENRPALRWVLSLPREWTTTSERLVLTVLAIDSYDGQSCSPNRDAILHATGLWGDTYYRALNGLCAATSRRPPLLDVERRPGARTVYRFLTPQSGNPDRVTQSGNPDPVREPYPVGESRPGTQPEPSRATQSGNPVGQPSRGTQSGNPDYHHSLPLPTVREGEMREEAARPLSAGAPSGSRLDVDRLVPLVFDALHQRWKGNHQPVVTQRARHLLGQLLDAGWSPEQVIAAVGTIGVKPGNPSALLEAHLRKQVDEHRPDDYGDGTPPAVPLNGKTDTAKGDTCRHGVDRTRTKAGKRKTACQDCDAFRRDCQRVINDATRAGFTLIRDRPDADGERLYTLQGKGRAAVAFTTDRNSQWVDLSLEVRKPTEGDVALLRDLFTVPPTVVDDSCWVLLHQTADREFLSALAHLVDLATDWNNKP